MDFLPGRRIGVFNSANLNFRKGKVLCSLSGGKWVSILEDDIFCFFEEKKLIILRNKLFSKWMWIFSL